jgi:flagella basal body P-ring formation protein FlgA
MNRIPARIRSLAIAATSAVIALGSASALAQQPVPDAVRTSIEHFVQTQAAGMPGQVSVRIQPTASGSLPPCDTLEPFLPAGTTLSGRVSIGLRCRSEAPWTRYVSAYIAVEGRYYVAARAIEPGESLGLADITERTGDLAGLPRSVVTSTAVLNGVVAANRIAAGAPLRKELLRGTVVIQQGQTVQVVAQGVGFTVSTEAKAMTRAEVGASVQAKTRDGRLVTGIADPEGQVRLAQ